MTERTPNDIMVDYLKGQIETFLRCTLEPLERQKKEEIDQVVDGLREKYGLSDSLTKESLESIAADYDCSVHYSFLAHVPISDRTELPVIILPEYTIVSNLAHELGHVILQTEEENEADYFMGQIIGEDISEINSQTFKEFVRYSTDCFKNRDKLLARGDNEVRRLIGEGVEMMMGMLLLTEFTFYMGGGSISSKQEVELERLFERYKQEGIGLKA